MEPSEPPPLEKSQPVEVDKKLTRFRFLAFFLSLLVVFAVHVALCLACTYHERSWIRDPQWKTTRNVYYIAQRLEKYRNEHKSFPDKLEELFTKREMTESYIKYELSDGWLHPLIYSTEGNSWQLLSYGSDGKPGGVGVEIDILCNDKMLLNETIMDTCKEMYPTMKQILDGGFIKETFVWFIIDLPGIILVVIIEFVFAYLLDVKISRPRNYRDVLIYSLIFIASMSFYCFLFSTIAMIPSARK